MDNAFVRRMFAILVTIVVMTAFMLFHPLQISAQTQDYTFFGIEGATIQERCRLFAENGRNYCQLWMTPRGTQNFG